MYPKSIFLFFIISFASALAQLSPSYFSSGFSGDFSSSFSDFGSGSSSFPSEGGGRSNTGPILFPPSPESRDTSGVVVGASGYGFVPPGSSSIGQSRELPPSFSGSFGSHSFGNPFF